MMYIVGNVFDFSATCLQCFLLAGTAFHVEFALAYLRK